MDRNELCKLQYSWSKCRSKAIEDGAKYRVHNGCKLIRSSGLRLESVLVVGPQHGFELEAFRDEGIQVEGLDVVPEFCNDCTELGFVCHEIAMEDVDPATFGKYDGVYASHSIEHFFDATKAVSNIMAIASWCLINAPIEPAGGKDKAHLSRVSDASIIRERFAAWEMVCQQGVGVNHKPGDRRAGNYMGLFALASGSTRK